MARKLFERALTDEQEDEILDRYLEEETTYAKLAEEYGVSIATIHRIVSNSKRLESAERRADMRARRALLRLKYKTEQAALVLTGMVDSASEQNVYENLQVVQQILDRAGVRAKADAEKEIAIMFKSDLPVKLGTPKEEDS